MEVTVTFWGRIRRSLLVMLWYLLMMTIISIASERLINNSDFNGIMAELLFMVLGGLAIASVFWLLKKQRIELLEQPVYPKIIWHMLLLTVGLLCVVITHVQLLQLLGTGVETTENQVELVGRMSQIPMSVSIMLFAIIGPIYEEIIFRGLMIHYICQRYSTMGLLISSLVFASLHLSTDIWQWSIYFIMGLYLGIVYLRTRNLYLVMGIHILNNLVSVLSFYGMS